MGCENFSDCQKSAGDDNQGKGLSAATILDLLKQRGEKTEQHLNNAGRKGDEALQELDKAAQEAQKAVETGLKDAAEKLPPAVEQARRDLGTLGRSLGNILDQGINALTPTDTKSLVSRLTDKFDDIDTDHDGFISRKELGESKNNLALKLTMGGTLNAAEKHFDNLQGLNRDSLIWDNNGISRKDLQVLDSARRNGTGLGEAFANAPTLDLKQHVPSAGLGFLAATASKAGTPGKALMLGATAFVAAEAAIGSMSYKLFTAPKANAIMEDLK